MNENNNKNIDEIVNSLVEVTLEADFNVVCETLTRIRNRFKERQYAISILPPTA